MQFQEIESALRYRLGQERDKAEHEAWNALSRYKFQIFGYWCSIWVHLNRISGLHSPNPFSNLVKEARTVLRTLQDRPQGR